MKFWLCARIVPILQILARLAFVALILLHVYAQDTSGSNSLCNASNRGNLGEMQLLIGSGANPNRAGAMRYTPLGLAVRGEQVEAVKLLLKSGANPNLPGGFGETPLRMARALDAHSPTSEDATYAEIEELLVRAGGVE